MNLFTVMTEVGLAVDQIAGLRVKAWDQEQVTPPAALVTLPATVNYHGAYGTGLQEIKDLVVMILIGKGSLRMALKRACEYAAASGAKSVKVAIEGYTYTSLDTITVTSVNFVAAQEAGDGEYLAAVFHCDITGPAT